MKAYENLVSNQRIASTYAPRGGGVKPPYISIAYYMQKGEGGPESMYNFVRTK